MARAASFAAFPPRPCAGRLMQGMEPDMALRLLVVEGNVQSAREAHRATFGKTPSQSYADTLTSIAPDAVCDICLPADAGANLPNGAGLSDYDGVAVTGSALNV